MSNAGLIFMATPPPSGRLYGPRASTVKVAGASELLDNYALTELAMPRAAIRECSDAGHTTAAQRRAGRRETPRGPRLRARRRDVRAPRGAAQADTDGNAGSP